MNNRLFNEFFMKNDTSLQSRFDDARQRLEIESINMNELSIQSKIKLENLKDELKSIEKRVF